VIVPVAFEAHHFDHLAPVLALLPHGKQFRNPDDVALVASYGALIRARRAKFRRFILAQHGAGQSYAGEARTAHQPGYPGGKDNADVGLFLVPNEHAAKRWRATYPKAAVAVVGCPKLDALPTRVPGPGPVIALSFHWAAHFSPEAGSAFADFAAAIPRLQQLGYHIIGHGHPLRQDLPSFYRRHGIEYVKAFTDVCRRADVYVCDNSSTIFEFAATGRPVVLLNSPRYRRNIPHGLRFWDAAPVGVQCDSAAALPAAIAEALQDGREAQREAALDIVYAYRTGAAQRAADAVLDWAGQLQAVA